jgi:hypothetical protein
MHQSNKSGKKIHTYIPTHTCLCTQVHATYASATYQNKQAKNYQKKNQKDRKRLLNGEQSSTFQPSKCIKNLYKSSLISYCDLNTKWESLRRGSSCNPVQRPLKTVETFPFILQFAVGCLDAYKIYQNKV